MTVLALQSTKQEVKKIRVCRPDVTVHGCAPAPTILPVRRPVAGLTAGRAGVGVLPAGTRRAGRHRGGWGRAHHRGRASAGTWTADNRGRAWSRAPPDIYQCAAHRGRGRPTRRLARPRPGRDHLPIDECQCWHYDGRVMTKLLNEHVTYRDSQQAFERAIREGRLSTDPNAANYAGLYMYMHTEVADGHDAFKNINTRRYDV